MGIKRGLETFNLALYFGNCCVGSGIEGTTTSSFDGTGDRDDSVVGLEGHNIASHSGQVIIHVSVVGLQVGDTGKKIGHICGVVTMSIDVGDFLGVEGGKRYPIIVVRVLLHLNLNSPFGCNGGQCWE